MKKHVIAATLICMAAISQGAQFTWKTAKSNNVNPIDGMTDATVYIFESTAAESILAAFVAGEDWTAGKLDSTSISAAGKINETTTPFVYGDGPTHIDSIFVFTENINGTKYLYISSVGSADGEGVGAKTISFSEKGVSTAIMNPGTYAGAGWYAAVPEPTSGFLLLLGFAGLALKRRRA